MYVTGPKTHGASLCVIIDYTARFQLDIRRYFRLSNRMALFAVENPDAGLVTATWKLAQETQWLALFTAAMTVATIGLAYVTRRAFIQQTGVQTWLEFEKRFDSKEMKRARKKLAELMPYKPTQYEKINEELLDLFESIAIAYNEGWLNKRLAACSFGYYAAHWWTALEFYVKDVRMKKQADDDLFGEFAGFAKVMAKYENPMTDVAMAQFYKEEKLLVTE